MNDKLFPIADIDSPDDVRVILYNGHDSFAHVPLQELLKFAQPSGRGDGSIVVDDLGLCNSEKMVTFQIPAGGAGDMKSSMYDKQCVRGDAFDMTNMREGENKLILTPDERAEIAKVSGAVSDITTAQADIVKLEKTAAEHTADIGALKVKDASLDRDIAALKAKDESLDGDIAGLRASDEALNGAIVTLQGKDRALDGEIAALKAKDQSLDRDISGLKDKDTALDRDIEGLRAKDGSLDGDISALRDKDTELDGEIADLKKKDVSLDADVAGLKAKDVSLDQDIAGLRAKDVSLDQQIKILQDKDAALDDEISGLHGKHTDHSQSLVKLTECCDVNKANIEQLQHFDITLGEKDQELQRNIDKVDECCDNNAVNIAQLQHRADTNLASINALKTKDLEHDKALDALKKDTKRIDLELEHFSNTATENEANIQHFHEELINYKHADKQEFTAYKDESAKLLATTKEDLNKAIEAVKVVADGAVTKTGENKAEIDKFQAELTRLHHVINSLPLATRIDQAVSIPFLVARDANNMVLKGNTTLYMKIAEDEFRRFHTDVDMTINVGKSLAGIARVDPGKDYYVYLVYIEEGDKFKFVISNNSTFPAGYTAATSRKIGGFHTLCADVGTIAKHPLSGYVARSILPQSVWCLNHRPLSDAAGMVYDPSACIWVDIYLQSGSGATTASMYNATVVTNREFLDHVDELASKKKILLSDDEFLSAMRGSNDGAGIATASLTAPPLAGGHKTSSGVRMISYIGCEEGCGYVWQFLRDLTTATMSGFRGGWEQFRCVLGGGSHSTPLTAIGRYHRDASLVRGAAKLANVGSRGGSVPRYEPSMKT